MGVRIICRLLRPGANEGQIQSARKIKEALTASQDIEDASLSQQEFILDQFAGVVFRTHQASRHCGQCASKNC